LNILSFYSYFFYSLLFNQKNFEIQYFWFRLKKKNITCLHPSKINTVGKINIVALDKTGTLTQDSLKLKGYIQTKNSKLDDKLSTNIIHTKENINIILSLSSCHSVKLIDEIILGDNHLSFNLK
jgi:cation-transporting P-type ATPase 13A2